jgi:hypothetical protein
MRFSTAVNVLLLGVATVVSALPIAQFTSSLDLESRDDFDVPDMFEREFDEPALYRRIEYHVALHKSNVGKESEHWAMHIHPQNSHKTANWHIVDAASEKGKGGVLQTDHQPMVGYDKTRQGEHHMILGSFPNAASAHAAAESLKGIHCTEKYPGHNCVDWTKAAVAKLHEDKHIKDDKKAEFDAHYTQHAATVRAKTDTAANRAKGI